MRYVIIKWSSSFDSSQFLLAKQQGIVQSRIDTIRKSLDGTLAVLKWPGTTIPATLPTSLRSLIVGQYTQEQILVEMQKPAWFVPRVEPINIATKGVTRTVRKRYAYVAAAATGVAAAGLAYAHYFAHWF